MAARGKTQQPPYRRTRRTRGPRRTLPWDFVQFEWPQNDNGVTWGWAIYRCSTCGAIGATDAPELAACCGQRMKRIKAT